MNIRQTNWRWSIVVLIGASLVAIPIALTLHRYANEYELKILISNIFRAHRTYNQVHGTIPCAINKVERPIISWRVEMYPYIGSNNFLSRFNLTLPHDDERNVAALKGREGVDAASYFQIPTDKKARIHHWTSILRISGPRTLGEGFNIEDLIPDGASDTALLVISEGSEIIWTSPHDLDIQVDKNFHSQDALV